MNRSSIFIALALVVSACSPEGDATSAISSCAKDLYPAYNPKSFGSVRGSVQEM